MAQRLRRLFSLTSLLVLCVVPSTEPLPVRFRDVDPLLLPTPADPVVTTYAAPPKPDPLENIGVELIQGFLIEGDIRIWHGFPAQEDTYIDSRAGLSQKSFGPPITNSHQMRNSVASSETWLEKIIPYEIDPTFNSTEKQIILEAINEVMADVNMCVQFVAREKQEDFVYIDGKQSGCWSDIGKQGGKQTVSISQASECISKGIIMHELLHSLGFWHEHNRPDRDKYIEILRNHIRIDHLLDFDINKNGKMLTAYDYYSIMHYKTNQFSKNSLALDTIRIIQPGIDETKVGQREHLTESDKQRIVILYQCKKPTRSSVSSSRQSMQFPENQAHGTWKTTEAWFGAMLTDPVPSPYGSEPKIQLVPQTPTLNTHIEAVQENLPTSTEGDDQDIVSLSFARVFLPLIVSSTYSIRQKTGMNRDNGMIPSQLLKEQGTNN